MCPICLATTLTALLAGATSAGGAAVLVAKLCRCRKAASKPTKS